MLSLPCLRTFTTRSALGSSLVRALRPMSTAQRQNATNVSWLQANPAGRSGPKPLQPRRRGNSEKRGVPALSPAEFSRSAMGAVTVETPSASGHWSKIAIIKADRQPIKTTMLRNANVVDPDQAELRALFEQLHRCGGKKKVFLRQGFTESGPEEARQVQRVFDDIKCLAEEFGNTELLWPAIALHRDNFKSWFTEHTGIEFTANNFWNYRRPMIEEADLVISVRSGLSESTSLEIGYKLGLEAAAGRAVLEALDSA